MDPLQETPRPRKRPIGIMIALSLFLLLVLFFLWRMLFYYVQVRQGNVEPPRAYLQSITFNTSEPETLPSPTVDPSSVASKDDPSLGNERAILTIVEFADFGCPFSREASYIARLIASHTDRVQYIYRDFPLLDLHPNAALAAEAGECAQEQDRFFDYHDKVYQNQFDLSSDALKRYALELGLDPALFNLCLDSHRYAAEVEEDRQAGVTAGVRGTPTFFFNGHRIEGAVPRTAFDAFLAQFAGIPVSIDTEP